MSSKEKNIYTFLGKVILVTLLIVLFIRCFFVESFTICSPQMESTLSGDDKVLIYKTTYGIRIPITILSIPFTFDNMLGLKSYSSAIELPYKRLFESGAKRDDIVLFNNPVETDKPLDKRSLILSRIAGIPGDSIEMREGQVIVNGQKQVVSPATIDRYKIASGSYDIEKVISELDIRIQGQKVEQDTLILHLNKYDAFVLNECLPDTINLIPCPADSTQSYKFAIPRKSENISITEDNFAYYRQIIQRENNTDNVVFDNGILFIDGVKQDGYTFRDDYYWVLSDNKEKSLDSRHLGFVPFSNIIGKAGFIWYSKDKSHRFSSVE